LHGRPTELRVGYCKPTEITVVTLN